MSKFTTITEMAMQKIENKEDIKSLLVQFGDNDADFNGDNGDDYLWDSAKSGGFDNNRDFLTDYVVNHLGLTAVEDIVDAFAKEWNACDGYYYSISPLVEHIDDVYAASLTLVSYV